MEKALIFQPVLLEKHLDIFKNINREKTKANWNAFEIIASWMLFKFLRASMWSWLESHTSSYSHESCSHCRWKCRKGTASVNLLLTQLQGWVGSGWSLGFFPPLQDASPCGWVSIQKEVLCRRYRAGTGYCPTGARWEPGTRLRLVPSQGKIFRSA